MGNLNVQSRWRNDLQELRDRLRHRPAANDQVFPDGELLATVESAEDVVRAPILDTSSWNSDAQQSFDAAVEQLVQHLIANPDWALTLKDGDRSRSWKELVPISVLIFWENFAHGRLPGQEEFDFVVARVTKRRRRGC